MTTFANHRALDKRARSNAGSRTDDTVFNTRALFNIAIPANNRVRDADAGFQCATGINHRRELNFSGLVEFFTAFGGLSRKQLYPARNDIQICLQIA